ncbi:MAG: hypothetical protein Q7J73_06380 [Dehalococcoidales bacterium]|nr:hypothetical protein [Dehalococcoidales bacterium]
MRITMWIITVLLGGQLLVSSACASQATTTPSAKTPEKGPAAFTTSGLRITPSIAKPGETVMVDVTLTNTGDQTGTYTAELKVDGSVVQTQDIILYSGVSRKVTLIMSVNSVGTHIIMIGNLVGNLVVQDAVAPAPTQPAVTPTPTSPVFVSKVIVSDLKIEPQMPKPGQVVLVTCNVTNTGAEQGIYTVVLSVNPETQQPGEPYTAQTKSQDITLAGSTSQQVTIEITAGAAGTYKISVGDLSKRMVVE